MTKRFKSKKRTLVKLKSITFLVICLAVFIIVFNKLYNIRRKAIKDEDVINYLIFNDYNSNYNDFIKLNSTEFLLKYSLGIDFEKPKEEVEDLRGDYIEDPSINTINEPLIYIYNTHQNEGYNKDITTSYNITPTVMLTSYMLRENLNNIGINTIVETNNIANLLNDNGWSYSYSYKASRIYLEEAYKNNPTLKIFIDIHRDSSNYESTTLVDEVKYAKVLFVVGLDYSGYEDNLNKAYRLNEIINDIKPGISRGVLEKSGSNVNGIYNQDFLSNTFLIEVGGQYNSIDEIKNTIDPLSKAINEYVKENNYET